MSGFVLNQQHLREVLIFCFHWKKSPAETHQLLVQAYGESVPTEESCNEWFERFRNGDFSIEPRPEEAQKIKDEKLENEEPS